MRDDINVIRRMAGGEQLVGLVMIGKHGDETVKGLSPADALELAADLIHYSGLGAGAIPGLGNLGVQGLADLVRNLARGLDALPTRA